MGKTTDELVVKIAKAQEGADVFDFCWDGPVFNAGNFYRVHASPPLFKNYPQCHNTYDFLFFFTLFITCTFIVGHMTDRLLLLHMAHYESLLRLMTHDS